MAWLRSRDVVFAVHEEAQPGEAALQTPVLGVVGWGGVGRFPERIFADLLPRPRPKPVALDSPLPSILDRFESESRSALPVFAPNGEFAGAVTRTSVCAALRTGWTPGSSSLPRTLRRLHSLETYALRVRSLAHDLANAIAPIEDLAALLLQGDPAPREAAWIQEASQQAVALLARLREANAEAPLAAEILDGTRLLEGLAEHALALLPSSVELIVRNGWPEGKLRADPTDLDRIVSNLVLNASEAMSGGGRVALDLDRFETRDEEVDALGRPIASGSWTRIAVTDWGHGMDDSTLSCAFQPQFSTRAQRGRGFGLCTVLHLVRRNGGYLRCSSTPGQGTTFEVLLRSS